MDCRCDNCIIEYESNHPLADDAKPYATTLHCSKKIHRDEIVNFLLWFGIFIGFPWTCALIKFLF